MPKPFLSVAPQRLAPAVLTCEHATRRLPTPARPGPEEREVLASHWGWDIGAWALTRELARRLGTSAVGGRWSRLYIDLNRRVDDPTLIRAHAAGVPLSWNAAVDVAEVERRVLEIHTPYHVEVDRLILRRVVRGIRPILVAVHSFTPVFDGRPRRFDVGVLYERDGGLARVLGRSLGAAGLSVRYNQPYSGLAGMMYSADRHAKHHGLACLEIEVNHSLLEGSGTPSRLGRFIARGIEAVIRRTSC